VVVAPFDAVVEPVAPLDALDEDAAELLDESSPPQAAATIPKPTTTAATARVRVLTVIPQSVTFVSV
jgi:hypothetical protein